MKSSAQFFFLLALVAWPASGQADWTAQKSSRADVLLRQVVAGRVPSVTAAVSIDGKVVYAKGFGLIAPGTAPKPETLYSIGSVSKQFTAAAILALEEDGATVPFDKSSFGIDDNLSKFFSGVDAWSPPALPMTVRRLLNMTSNLPSYTSFPPAGLSPTAPVSSRNLLNGVKHYMPQGSPMAFGYSNTNYFLLAQIIECVTSPNCSAPGNYRQYLRDRIFQRAGLSATGFRGDPVPPSASVARPGPVAGPAAFALLDWPKGAGEIRSNVLDLIKWDEQLFSGHVIGDSGLDTMLSPAAPASASSSYAMGWYVRRLPAGMEYSHDGGIPGFTAQNLVWDLDDSGTVAVAILTNGNGVRGLDALSVSLAQIAVDD